MAIPAGLTGFGQTPRGPHNFPLHYDKGEAPDATKIALAQCSESPIRLYPRTVHHNETTIGRQTKSAYHRSSRTAKPHRTHTNGFGSGRGIGPGGVN